MRGQRAAIPAEADEILHIVIEEKVPMLVATQGAIDRFHPADIPCIRLMDSGTHGLEALVAGVNAIIAVDDKARGHPPPYQISTLVRCAHRESPRERLSGPSVMAGTGVVVPPAVCFEFIQQCSRNMTC